MTLEPTHETIQVLGASFGRTGTTSLKQALNSLGFKCYHMVEVTKPQNKSTHPQLWIDACEGKLKDYDLIFKSENSSSAPYTATCDWPSTTVWEEIYKQYPNAKVILTERDSESWYKSCENTIWRLTNSVPGFYLKPRSFRCLIYKVIWDGSFQGRFADKEYAIDVYKRHNERIRQVVPEDRLLVLDITQNGNDWSKLCRFLNVPIPEDGRPFPRANDTKEMVGRIRKLNIVSWLLIGGAVGLVATLIGLVSLINVSSIESKYTID